MSDRREICHRKCHINRRPGGDFIVSDVYDNNLASDLTPVSGTDASVAHSQTSAEPARSCDPAVSALSQNFSTENATPAPRPEALPAGRGLDALVAERLFGWTQIRLEGSGLLRGRPAEWENRGNPFRKVPRYSTDIAAAWQVVERMVADGRWPEIEYWPSTKGTPWRCDVTGPDPKVDLRVWADTAPLAICRAALAAVERAS